MTQSRQNGRWSVAMAVMVGVAASGLTGCGGGSGGNPSSPDNQLPPGQTPGNTIVTGDPLPVTVDNAPLIAFLTLSGLSAMPQMGAATSSAELIAMSLGMSAAKQGGAVPDPACKVSGTQTFNLVDSDGDQSVSSGDSLNTVYDNCNDGFATSNGTSAFSVQEFVSDSASEASKIVTQSVADTTRQFKSGDRSALKGTMIVSLETSADGLVTRMGLEAPALTSEQGGVRTQLEAFTASQVIDDGNDSTTVVLNGRSTDNQVGAVTVKTLKPFVAVGMNDFLLPGNEYFGQGELEISYPTTKINLKAVSSTNVEVRVDLEGDGVFETVIPETWANLTFASMKFGCERIGYQSQLCKIIKDMP